MLVFQSFIKLQKFYIKIGILEPYPQNISTMSGRRAMEVRVGRSSLPQTRHPMSLERLKEYAFDLSEPEQPRVHSWYKHNIDDQGQGVALFLRNFAIVFNNLGLERL